MLDHLNWSPDPAAVSRLAQLVPGLVVEPVLTPLSKIDREWGLQTNARGTHALNNEIVLEYATAMAAGDAFPAVVLRRILGSAKLGPISGNHRLASVAMLVEQGDIAERDAQVLAYQLPVTDEMALDIFMRSANRQGGWRQSRVEAIQHCLGLLEKYPALKPATLAPFFSLKESSLADELRARKARANLSAANVNTEGMAKDTILKIDQLSYSQPLTRLVGQMAAEYRMPSARVASLVNEVKEAGSEEAGRAAVMRTRENLQKEKTPARGAALPTKVVRKGRSRLYQAINTLHTLLFTGNKGKPVRSLRDLDITDPHDRSELNDKWREAKRHLDTLLHDAQKGK